MPFGENWAAGGQVYVVHNRIEDIEQLAEEIRLMVPGGPHSGGPRTDERTSAGTNYDGFYRLSGRRVGLHHHY